MACVTSVTRKTFVLVLNTERPHVYLVRIQEPHETRLTFESSEGMIHWASGQRQNSNKRLISTLFYK